MSILKNAIESQGVDSNKDLEDVVGGFINTSGIHDVEIRRAYAIEAESGSIGIRMEFTGLEYDMYVTTKEKKTYYTKDGKDFSLPSYSLFKKIHYIATGDIISGLANVTTSERLINVSEWVDKERKDIEKTVEYLDDLAGKSMKIAVQMEEQEGYEDGKPTGKVSANKDGKPYLRANIIRVYNDDGFTATEIMGEATETKALNSDTRRLEKNPIKLFKAKAPKKSSGGSNSGGVKKPVIF